MILKEFEKIFINHYLLLEEDLKQTIAGSIGILTDFNPFEGRDSHGAIQTSWDNSD